MGTTQRLRLLPQSDALFRKWLAESYLRKFEYGVWDCCLMVADHVQNVTGTDIADDLRYTYSSPLGAYRVIKKHGGLQQLVDDRVGNRINVKNITAKNIVLVRYNKLLTLGVVICYPKILLINSYPYISEVNKKDLITAWEIPN